MEIGGLQFETVDMKMRPEFLELVSDVIATICRASHKLVKYVDNSPVSGAKLTGDGLNYTYSAEI